MDCKGCGHPYSAHVDKTSGSLGTCAGIGCGCFKFTDRNIFSIAAMIPICNECKYLLFQSGAGPGKYEFFCTNVACARGVTTPRWVVAETVDVPKPRKTKIRVEPEEKGKERGPLCTPHGRYIEISVDDYGKGYRVICGACKETLGEWEVCVDSSGTIIARLKKEAAYPNDEYKVEVHGISDVKGDGPPSFKRGQWVRWSWDDQPPHPPRLVDIGLVENTKGPRGPYEIRLASQWDENCLPWRSGYGFIPLDDSSLYAILVEAVKELSMKLKEEGF